MENNVAGLKRFIWQWVVSSFEPATRAKVAEKYVSKVITFPYEGRLHGFNGYDYYFWTVGGEWVVSDCPFTQEERWFFEKVFLYSE